MYLMFQAIAKGSWKAPLIICVLILFGGLALQNSIDNDIVEREQALRTAQPDPTSLDVFDRKTDIHPADEVHVTARLNADYNYRLIQEKDGRANQVRFMYVFFGPSQAGSTKQARAAVILDAEDKDTFANQLHSQTAEKLRVMINETGDKSFEPDIFTLAGLRERRPDLKKIADQAFEEQGLVKGPDFIYIEPFLNGRTAGLRPDYEFLRTWQYVWGTLFAIFALITAFKFMGRQKWQAKRDAQQAARTYRAPQSNAQKASVAQAPWQPTAAPTTAENATKSNPAESLLEWAQKHPILAIAAAFFVLLIVLPGTAISIAPFLFAGGYMYLQFSAGQKIRSGLGSLFGQSRPAKGTLPNGQVYEAAEPPKYHVPPVTTPKAEPTRYQAPAVEEPAPTPRPSRTARPTRRSVLGRNESDSPIQRKQSLGRRMGSLFQGKEDTSDPFRRLNRG